MSTPIEAGDGNRVFIRLGPPPEEPNQFVVEGAPQEYPADVLARLEVEAKAEAEAKAKADAEAAAKADDEAKTKAEAAAKKAGK